MNRLLTLLLLSLGAGLGPMAFAAEAPRPNVIFFLVDDMGYMDIGANNPKSFYETPNIDRLAARGMRFTDGYAACPVCSPTRASIMAGKYPPRVGITDWIRTDWNKGTSAGHLALAEVTIAEAMRDRGYATFFSGKWHLGDGQYGPNAQGFGPGLQGKAYEYYPPNNDPQLPGAKDDPKKTDRVVSDFMHFLETNKDKPFFAYLPFTAVHQKIGARADLVEKYKHKPVPSRNPPTEADLHEYGHQHLVQNNPVYAGMIDQLDSAIGRVMAALKQNGLEERTIVIFMSDNGGLSTAEGSPTSNLPLRAGKGWMYEGGIREPLIIFAPGVTKPGSLCKTPVISTDFYPTILELAGLPLLPNQHRDGISLVPLLKGGPLDRGPIFWHYPHHSPQGGGPAGAVRDRDWKLIEWFNTGKVELFNLASDLSEKHDLASANPGKVKELQAKLAAWRKEVNAIMPAPGKKHAPKAVPVKSLAVVEEDPQVDS
jgi:arylsulfatase A-like enzyme